MFSAKSNILLAGPALEGPLPLWQGLCRVAGAARGSAERRQLVVAHRHLEAIARGAARGQLLALAGVYNGAYDTLDNLVHRDLDGGQGRLRPGQVQELGLVHVARVFNRLAFAGHVHELGGPGLGLERLVLVLWCLGDRTLVLRLLRALEGGLGGIAPGLGTRPAPAIRLVGGTDSSRSSCGRTGPPQLRTGITEALLHVGVVHYVSHRSAPRVTAFLPGLRQPCGQQSRTGFPLHVSRGPDASYAP